MKKAELRAIYKQKRDALVDVEALSVQIAERFFYGFNLSSYSTIHIFLPAESKKEINTWLIIDRIRREYPQLRIVVPVVNWADGSMKSCLLKNDSLVRENKWGIPEPVEEIEVNASEVDLVLLPMLAFDKKGNRIGYGKGFYDKFLAQCKSNVFKAGLSFFEAEEMIEDVSEWDVPLDAAVTPEGFVRF